MIHLQLCSVQGKKDLSKFPDVFLQIAKCICASELQSAMCWASKSAAPIRRVSEHFVVIEQLCICPNCKMYYPNSKMYLSKFQALQSWALIKRVSEHFVAIEQLCICPNCEMYLSKFENVFIQI